MQTTLRHSVEFKGTGLHSGRPVVLRILPAPKDHGIVFVRTDVKALDANVAARWDLVDRSPLCTRLENKQGVSVSTVEHVMAALCGCGIHNAVLELSGPEVPILDGSSLPFVRGLINAGRERLNAPVRAIEILKQIGVSNGEAHASFEPADAMIVQFHIEFSDQAIGLQEKELHLSNGAFARELCDSRTFCRQRDVDAMRANGLAMGGTLRNAVVFDGDEVLSPGGLRHRDEPVRHKMLDAVGDLALAGAPILGKYIGHKAGHALTNTLLRELFARPDAWRYIELTEDQRALLPGAGVKEADICAFA
ncbi:MAG: UDP-3-O-acyl-N-acetylglucosamine deacetylase [Paracoccaceae bacterium]|nr:UDP-3-O-acyl-N-acetylglucosamine deacetylase [Paracoccaceae bacterium]MDG1739023.1 UDP-3-O-acyl-N-acetylglucosamine deacetylase [Paracoccaceae bacterium]MDG2257257.1 UDP-3-O-acyl-N-acetylglucosamine deacetylase [Paracoccaceae bacterium]